MSALHIQNIYRVWRQADAIDLATGLNAYASYHNHIHSLARRFGYSTQQACAAFAALSPNNSERGTFRALELVLDAHVRHHLPCEVRGVTTYRSNIEKAFHLLSGEPVSNVLRGRKTSAFYRCLIDPQDAYTVVVDGHMHSIWLGRRLTLDRARCSPRLYDRIAADYRYVADTMTKFRPCQLQSVCWFVWHRLHRILYQPQLALDLVAGEHFTAAETTLAGAKLPVDSGPKDLVTKSFGGHRPAGRCHGNMTFAFSGFEA